MKFDQLFEVLPVEIQLKMKSTYQDHRWHPEGSVYAHSRLVALLLPNTNTIQACALLHDIGKCFTTEVRETDFGIKITSFNHENYLNKHLLVYTDIILSLSAFKIDWSCVMDVCSQHMRMHKYNDGTIKKKSKREAIENMEYFTEMKLFADADKKGIGAEEDKLPYVILTVGISGSGKTTWRRAFVDKSKYYSICPDDIRKNLTGNISDQSKNPEVWERAFIELDNVIADKLNVVFDSTCTNLDTVKRLLRHCKDKAIVIFKILECDVDVAKARVNTDIASGVERSNVPWLVIDRQHKNLIDVKKFINEKDFLVLV